MSLCIYYYNKMSNLSESDFDNIIHKEVYHDYHDVLKNYDTIKLNNTTNPVLNKYEKTKVIGVRAQQLSLGAKPMIKPDSHTQDVVEIAEQELIQKKIPFLIKRKVGNKFEYWKIEDLNIY